MTTLVIDGNNISLAAASTGKDLRTDSGVATGGLFNFLRSINKLKREFSPSEMIVIWDSANPWRRDILPTYKESRKRERTPQEEIFWQEFNFQRGEMKRMTLDLGVSHVCYPRMEADDIAGHLGQTLEDDIVFVTNDNDWFQLVSETRSVYRPLKGTILSMDNFFEETQCSTVEEFVTAKSIVGDPGDDIPGVKGVGFITALKYLRGTLAIGSRKKDIEDWMSNENGYNRSRLLIDLRKEIPDYFPEKYTQHGSFNQDEFKKACAEYQFNALFQPTVNLWGQ